MPPCTFCSEFRFDTDFDGGDDQNYLSRLFGASLTSRTIRETTNFLVVPSIGQLVEGYLLVLPKRHFLSTGHLPQTLLPELNSVLEMVARGLEQAYGVRPILYEHGPVSEVLRAGCCEDHAHIHAVPTHADIRAALQAKLPGERIAGLSELGRWISGGRPYLFYRDIEGRQFLFDGVIAPSQYLRRLLAVELGVPHKWDWRVYPETDRLLKTLARLRPVLGEDSAESSSL